jgi:hypothetical protein
MASPPPYVLEDLFDANQHTAMTAEAADLPWLQSSNCLQYLGKLTVKQIERLANADDFAGWLEVRDEDDLVGYRGNDWGHREDGDWVERIDRLAAVDKIPPIILAKIPNYGTIVADGRGRINWANARKHKLHVYLLKEGHPS